MCGEVWRVPGRLEATSRKWIFSLDMMAWL